MTPHESSTIAVALRGAITAPEGKQPADPVGVLRESAERVLFHVAAIAPVAGIVPRALDRLSQEPDLTSLDDDELLQLWEAAVRMQIVAYCNRPESWEEPESFRFMEGCTVVFGVDLSMVPTLVQRFHGLSEGARYGIFLLIERSSMFSFLTREIDADEERRPVEDPQESFRSLMRQVFQSS